MNTAGMEVMMFPKLVIHGNTLHLNEEAVEGLGIKEPRALVSIRPYSNRYVLQLVHRWDVDVVMFCRGKKHMKVRNKILAARLLQEHNTTFENGKEVVFELEPEPRSMNMLAVLSCHVMEKVRKVVVDEEGYFHPPAAACEFTPQGNYLFRKFFSDDKFKYGI
jgi:hypothetical protein